jgi:hypothetical protein
MESLSGYGLRFYDMMVADLASNARQLPSILLVGFCALRGIFFYSILIIYC